MTSALIVNPQAGRTNGLGLRLAQRLRGTPGVEIRILRDFGEIADVLDDLAARGIERLFISSGDGTIHEIQTQLAERRPGGRLPKLGLLPHGTTNLSAGMLGLKTRRLDRQAAIVAAGRELPDSASLVTRPTLRIANPADRRVRHGMFVGTGAVYHGAQFCQQRIHASGLKGDWATFATLMAALAHRQLLRGRSSPSPLADRSYPIEVSADGELVAGGQQFCFIASTLDRLILRSRPFWGGSPGPLRANVYPHPLPNAWRWLPTMMYGGENRRLPDGCISFSSDRIEVKTDCPFILDGEFFDAPKDASLHIERGCDFTYIRSR